MPCLLLGGGELDAVVAEVVDRVPFSEKGITKDSQRSSGSRDVHAHESRDARALYLKDVIVSGDAEVVAGEVEGHIWKTVTRGAVDAVLSVITLLGTHLLVEEVGQSGWEGDQGSSSVEDDTGVGELGSLITKANGVEVNLPVGLAPERDLDHLAGVMALIDAAKDSFRSSLSFRGIAKVEGEDGLVNEALVDKAVERWDNLVHGDGVVSKTQDAIEPAEGKGQTGFLGSLREELVLDLEVADGDGILRNESTQTARAILDCEGAAVLGEGR